MYKAASLLQNARIDKDLSLEEISKKVKIPEKYLKAIEAEDSKSFPQEPYCSLIVKDYSEFLGLNSQQVLSLFRRDFAQKRKSDYRAKNIFSFTPKFTFYLLIFLTLFALLSFLVYEYFKFNQPPKLEVAWPALSPATSGVLSITGITDPEATVRINDDLVIVDQNGKFEKNLNVATPEAKIVIQSQSPNGKVTRVEKVYR
ncbi:MAG: helix-turn-helix domain-containing protein [Candidatus Shapirobacteria bacterium]|jgi:cytoskeletal protein RodZ